MKPYVLIVEDDPALVELLQYNFESEGYECQVARDGEAGVMAIEERIPDLVVLDWMLPNLSGVEVCRQVRRSAKHKSLPVIMLTAKGEEQDRIRGLDSGADDYVVKPFSTTELLARVRAVLRRANPAIDAETLAYEDVIMDLAEHRVTRDGAPVKLGPTEFRLLQALMERPGRVYSREQLLDKVWGQDIYVELRTVDVHIRRLRKALNNGDKPDLIRTVRSAGYALDAAKI